jgi:hypothetical protein
MEWYKIKKNVLNLMDFLISTELIISIDDVIDFSDHPMHYSEVWMFYQIEINGVDGVD